MLSRNCHEGERRQKWLFLWRLRHRSPAHTQPSLPIPLPQAHSQPAIHSLTRAHTDSRFSLEQVESLQQGRA